MQVRHGAQPSSRLNGLMRGAIFAQTNRAGSNQCLSHCSRRTNKTYSCVATQMTW